ncbi:MAG: amidohydrolase, partial [Proteobacteria bacterium]|nr:amidohydrolase [Pseudomonadota bacterium]
WLSLDVSPDGTHIAFDLLGDIYEVPIDGGEARALTHGVAWDMQPRYSPDGRHIAFTSDRGGGDNIWVMNRDGSHPRAVTKERFRLVNSPAWSPDGQYIAVRKHFTAHRSLGAGEVWLYHVAGGSGVQLTKRPNDQKDLGEPVFSPDGRYVYYSQDVTPGASFEYNKDVNGEIYVIQRLDRETGELERFVTGPGGSIRPTPSRDGRWLAFVRRVKGRSVLFVHDVRTGVERKITDGLERDMQETWAIHGVYPTFAFTPDDKAIVLWAGGHLQRVDVSTGKRVTIPFHVRDTRQVTEAVRFPVDVAPKTFTAKMIRWAERAPDGHRLIFQALGHLWAQDAPGAAPRRLTHDDAFELYPSLSRDGSTVVYVRWTDEGLGQICTVPAAGGTPKVRVREPGHYVEPCFSPDGQVIAWRKTTGGRITSPTHSHDCGVWAMKASGTAPWRVTREGSSPHFGASAGRLFVLRGAGDDMINLVSLRVTGGDERVEATCKDAQEMRISPDERWIAFVQGFNAFVAARPQTGKPLELGPRADNVPVAQISRDAGAYIAWTSDSRALGWTLGDRFFTRDLRDAFAFLRGDGAAPLADAAPAAREVRLDATADLPSGVTALTGGRVITMRGDEVLEQATVLVEGNRIRAIGPDVAIPSGANVVDCRGKTIMPG